MINASDLRIGNWVSIIGKQVQVKNIHPHGINKEVSHGDYGSIETNYAGIFYDQSRNNSGTISPIPITPDILVACGFKETYQKLFGAMKYSYHLGHFTYMDVILWKSYVMEPIQYLHQLQNIYWCLVQKELQYKPK